MAHITYGPRNTKFATVAPIKLPYEFFTQFQQTPLFRSSVNDVEAVRNVIRHYVSQCLESNKIPNQIASLNPAEKLENQKINTNPSSL